MGSNQMLLRMLEGYLQGFKVSLRRGFRGSPYHFSWFGPHASQVGFGFGA